MTRKKNQNGFIIEFIPMGNYIKVSAIDPITGREVSIVGDPKETQSHLENVAVKKLLYVLKKEQNNPDDGDLLA